MAVLLKVHDDIENKRLRIMSDLGTVVLIGTAYDSNILSPQELVDGHVTGTTCGECGHIHTSHVVITE